MSEGSVIVPLNRFYALSETEQDKFLYFLYRDSLIANCLIP